MRTSDQIDQLATALAKAQARIKGAAKDSANPFYHSRYADLASIWDACREPLTANGLSVTQSPTTAFAGEPEIYTTKSKSGEDRSGVRVATTVSVITRLCHASGQWIEGETSAMLPAADPQAVGSATTYLRRYSLASIVGVAPEDDDAESTMRAVPASARPAYVNPSGEIKLPGGPTKWDGFGGRAIADVPRKPLAAAYKWLAGRPGNEKLVKAIEDELEREDRTVDRQLTAVQAGDFDEPPAALKGDLED